MKIYVASSFRNVENVEKLITELRKYDFSCYSWKDNNVRISEIIVPGSLVFDRRLCADDLKEIRDCDILIYYPPAGCDASFELGYAMGLHKIVVGIDESGNCLGVMKHAVANWFDSVSDLINWLRLYKMTCELKTEYF